MHVNCLAILILSGFERELGRSEAPGRVRKQSLSNTLNPACPLNDNLVGALPIENAPEMT